MAAKSTPCISLCTALTVLFVGLRLADVIHWSWWWVLAPLWAPWALAALVGAVIMLVAVAAKVFQKINGGK